MKILYSVVAVLGAVTVVGVLAACATSRQTPMNTVTHVDLTRYAGKWYEIASYPVWFQRRCAGGTTAEYTPKADGSIAVVNTCFDKNDKPIRVEGSATVVPDSGNARLKVRFFGPFTGDYWIIALDQKDYSWALVGHPSRKYLWVLSRSKKLPPAVYNQIVAEAIVQGYNATQLRLTDQSIPR